MELVQPKQAPENAGRWAIVFAVAVLVHCLPMMLLQMSAPPIPADEPSIAVDLSSADFDLAEPTTKPEDVAKTVALPETVQKLPIPPAPKPVPAAPQKVEPPPVAPKPPPPETKKAPAQVPEPPPPPKVEAKPKLQQPDLDPFTAKPMVAFDESKSTKEVPKDGYLSDRNSTAADRGPKNLPRGDPFMDKGESEAIRYRERRGEGGLPAIPSEDGSGSVKKEGSPDAGKGPLENRPLDQKQPQKPVIIDEKIDNKPRSSDVALKPNPPSPVVPELQPETKILKPEAATAPEKEGPKDIGKTGEGDAPAPATPRPAKKPQPIERVAEEESRARQPKPDETEQRDPSKPEIIKVEPRDKKKEELEAFAALLEGKGRTDARGGDAGDKVGSNTRPGAKGHEGNGTLRPGHDEAVSDVTTVNLESSAAEFDDARFAKRYDPKTAYVKPLARRIDNKWKAERTARNRVRIDHGIVTMKIVVRKDGKLIEATELERRPKSLPDEYAADAKLAIERAADPLSEPFPAELRDRETLEFIFNFLY